MFKYSVSDYFNNISIRYSHVNCVLNMELLVIFIQHLEYVQLNAVCESISDFIQLLDYVFGAKHWSVSDSYTPYGIFPFGFYTWKHYQYEFKFGKVSWIHRLGKLRRISHFDYIIEITFYRHLMSTRCLPLLKILLGRCIFYTQPADFSLDRWQGIVNVIGIFSVLELLKCKRLLLRNTSPNW